MFTRFRRSMMARMFGLGLAALVTGGSQVTCSSDGTGDFGGNGPTFTTTLVLKNSAGAADDTFQPGEPVTFELTVRNRSSRTVELDFSSSHQFEFLVFFDGGDRPRWRWSDDKSFTTASTTLTFAPQESRVFSATWDQVTPAGPLAPGGYEARGALLFDELRTDPLAPHELGSTLRSFSID